MLQQFFPANKNNGLLSLLLAGFFFACTPGENSRAQTEVPTRQNSPGYPLDSVFHLPEFELYIPPTHQDNDTISIILFLDPQADGKLPLSLYAPAARERGIVLAGSNLCRNGIPAEEAMRLGKEFFHSVIGLFPGKEKQVYLAGFSGGAVLASVVSSELPVIKGLIYAAAPGIKTPACPAIGFCGLADPNFYEMQNTLQQIPEKIPHCIRNWNGKHAWPDLACMSFAFDWITAMEENKGKASHLIGKFRKSKEINSNPGEMEAGLQTLYFLSSSLKMPGAGEDSLLLAAYRSSKTYKNYKAKQEIEIHQELQLKQFYQNAMLGKDLSWWKEETRKLKLREPGNWKNQRILGFLSLLAWSVSTRALQQASTVESMKFSDLYEIIDPENPEPCYQKAVIYSRIGDQRNSEDYFRKALDLGFSDKKRVLNQSEFQGKSFETLMQD